MDVLVLIVDGQALQGRGFFPLQKKKSSVFLLTPFCLLSVGSRSILAFMQQVCVLGQCVSILQRIMVFY